MRLVDMTLPGALVNVSFRLFSTIVNKDNILTPLQNWPVVLQLVVW
jgi:hypothetical protein